MKTYTNNNDKNNNTLTNNTNTDQTMKNLNEITFAYSTDTVTNPKSNNKSITFNEMVNIIKGDDKPSYYDSIASTTIKGLYNEVDVKEIKKQINPLKMRLPFFMFSGYQAVGHNNTDIEYNGCVQIDIDFKEMFGEQMAQDAKQQLTKLPYVLFAGISPSGVGVKALVRTNNLNKANHLEALNQVINDMCNTLVINKEYFDSVGSSQPVFTFFDKDLYVNEDAEIFVCSTFKSINVKSSRVNKNVALNSNITTTKTIGLTDSELQKGLQVAYNCAKKRRGQTVDTTFIQTYVGVTLNFGIGSKDAFDYLVAQGHTNDLNNKRTNSFYALYDRYNDSFGTLKVAYNIGEYFAEDQINYTLNKNQKLSDIELDLTKNSMIVSPTGTGKSYFVGNKLTMKRIMVVPTKTLVQQFSKEYGASMFYQEDKELTNKNFIVTTYSSLSNLCNHINPSEYTLFIDESHNTSSSTSANYLLKQLNSVIDLVNVFQNYHLLTATPLFSFNEAISSLRVLKVTKPITYTKTVTNLRYEDFYKTLQLGVQASVKVGAQYAILSNNTKDTGRLGRIKGALKAYNSVIINSTMKDEQSYVEVAIDGDLTNYEGMITTSIIKEGNSIVKHSDVVNVFIDGSFHPVELEQYCSRFRNAKEINLFIMKSDKQMDTLTSFNQSLACESLVEYVNETKSYIDSVRNNPFAIKDQLNMLEPFNKGYFRESNNDIVIDYLAMSNAIFEEEKKAANTDYDYMTTYLKRFGWDNKGLKTTTSKLTSADNKSINSSVKAAKVAKEIKVNNIFDIVSKETKNVNDSTLEENLITCKVEQDIRYKVSVISTYTDYDCEDLNDAVNHLRKIGLTTQAWTNFNQSATIQKLRTSSDLMKSNNGTALLIKNVYNDFKVGASYTTTEIEEMMNKITTTHLNNKLTKNKAIKVLKTFFTTKTKSVRSSEGKIYKKIEIVNDNALGLTVNSDTFQEKMFRMEEFQTNQELINFTNVF